MARTALEALVLFALPFLAYVALLALRRRYPFLLRHWTGGRLALLAAAGLALVAAGLLVLGLLAPRHQGAYSPAHIEGGRLVPGQMR